MEMISYRNVCNAATSYSKLGYAVFPHLPDSKAPARQSGFKAAYRDPDQIARWFVGTGFNIGLAVPSGVVVVDVDPDGSDPLEELLEYILRLPTASTYKQRSLRAGVDVRLAGRGYFLAPPSTAKGKLYIWRAR